MQNQTASNLKLGIFVLGGLLFVILLLYMIGRNRNLFGSHFTLKARFGNVDGLKPGHNVRYAGIEVGTVSGITLINDTAIEVTMTIDDDLRTIISRTATASIGTDGLVGNKVVNISASPVHGDPAKDGELLASSQRLDTDQMLRTLSRTNEDVAVIAAQLRTAVTRINNSRGLWELLDDQSLPVNLRRSAWNIRMATLRADSIVQGLEYAIQETKNGKGLLGTLLYDTAISAQLSLTLGKFGAAADAADALVAQLSVATDSIRIDLSKGNGPLHALLKDSSLTNKLSRSLDNISKGTDGFNQNMEALKHHFLFRGYFRKLEKEQQKADQQKKTGN